MIREQAHNSGTDSMGASLRYAVNAWLTPHNSALEDVEEIARSGGRGIGLYEGKLESGGDQALREAIAVHRREARFCVPPRTLTILPVLFNTSAMERGPSGPFRPSPRGFPGHRQVHRRPRPGNVGVWQCAPRINSVHVNDVRVHARSNFDRELPGGGRAVAAPIMATLIESGYEG